MKTLKFYDDIKQEMIELINEYDLNKSKITITTKVLTPKEAIGETEKKDFPLLRGKEVLMNADFKGSIGQAFTDHPGIFKGSIDELMCLDLNKNNHNRALFIASTNAILNHLDLIENTIHCKDDGPEECSKEISNFLKIKYSDTKVAIVGFQPSIIDRVKGYFKVRVLDLNSENIGKEKYGVMIEDGDKNKSDVIEWADIVLVTGSTVVNGTIVDFLNLDKPVFFYGTTIAGIAYLKNLKRLCFCAG